MESRKLNIFTITFSNTQGIYYAGQNVQGHVTIEVNQDMPVQGVHLKFEGKAYVHWRGPAYDSSKSTYGNVVYYTKRSTNATNVYTATEQYFNHDVTLFGEGPGHQYSKSKTSLPVGRHTFPFTFPLPPKLPSSFEGEIGYVRFSVKAVISRPWKFDILRKRPFSVISIVDLNKDPKAKAPAQGQRELTTGCLCFDSGKISASFHLKHVGCVSGETIPLSVEIINRSNTRVKSSVELIMTARYYSTVIGKVLTTEVGQIDGDVVEPGSSGSYMGHKFVVPPLPPSQLVGCKLIHMNYTIQLRVDADYIDFTIPLELIIGTVPLRQTVKQAFRQHKQKSSSHHAQGSAKKYASDADDGDRAKPSAPPWTEMPPPSYSECMFGKATIKDDDDNENSPTNYTPMYVCYNFDAPKSSAPAPTFETLVDFL